MALQGYMKFEKNTLKVTQGNVAYKDPANLDTTGQHDNTATTEQNADFAASKGWFRVYFFEYHAGANVELGAGTSVGNITDASVKIMKLTGENTAIAYKAHYDRSMFNVRLVLANRAGNEKNMMEIEIVFQGAVFRKITSTTGDPTKGSEASSAATAYTDTKEIDIYEMVFQAADINTYKKKVHVSAQGASKSG